MADNNDLGAMVLRYRELKHSINNSLGVMMALSELSERDPANVQKLIKVVLERSPDIVERLQEFSDDLQAIARAVEEEKAAK